MGLFRVARSDAEYYYSLSGETTARFWLIKSIVNPSLRAAFLFRLCAATSGFIYLLMRSILLALHGCDVASGATFRGPIYLPHPTGIVLGRRVVIGRRVSIFQHVTLGRDGSGEYPEIGDDVILFAGCVVVGGQKIEAGSSVGALSFIGSGRRR